MTKYEWEKELKRNLARLPADEVSRALAFYDELFADKAEQGYSEREVINEFGNPFDVANSIIRDYEAENGGGKAEPAPKQDRKKQMAEQGGYMQNAPPQNNYNGYNGNAYNAAPEYAHSGAYYGGGYTGRDVRKAKSGGAAGAVMRILFFIPYVVLLIVSVSLLLGFGVAALGCVVGGVVYVCASFALISSGGALAAVSIGLGFAAIAVGALFAISVPCLYKASKSLSKTYFGIKERTFGNNREGY